MSGPSLTSVFQPSLTIKRKNRKDAMAKAKVVKMPTAAKRKAATTKKPKAKAMARTATPSSGRYIGKTSGLGIAIFQNKTIAGNRREHLTDTLVARMWRDEFPKAKAYTDKDVASVRSAYNKGKHGNDAPSSPIKEYDRDGNPIVKEAKSSSPPKKTIKKKISKKVMSKSAAKRKKQREEDDEEEEMNASSSSHSEEDEEE